MVSAVAFVSNHPLLLHKLGQLRDKNTAPEAFRLLVRELSLLLIYEAMQDAVTFSCSVETPLGKCPSVQLAERIGLVPILRSGLGMVDAILTLLPNASVWHLGLYRDHETLLPVTYYNRLPDTLPIDLAIVLDPMLATGGSAILAITGLKERGVPRIKFVGLIAAPEGVQALATAHPDVAIHVGAVDSHLNELGYIVPGLGDAGDRQFGTL
jgi:uracil phosphoribosyltransferase